MQVRYLRINRYMQVRYLRIKRYMQVLRQNHSDMKIIKFF
jgi:hypothetical protein